MVFSSEGLNDFGKISFLIKINEWKYAVLVFEVICLFKALQKSLGFGYSVLKIQLLLVVN